MYGDDNLHRLTEETCVPSQGSYRVGYDYRYSYDAVGNRTGKTIGSGIGRTEIVYYYSVRNELTGEDTYVVEQDEQGEELWVQIAAVEYSYDLRGNLVGKRDVFDYWWWWDYYWSADDKLMKAEYSTEQSGIVKTIEYKYDVLGRRVARRLNYGSWRWYFYDGLQVTAEGTGTTDKIYYTHSPSAIGGIIARDNNGTKLWYHYDRLGNVMAVTDSNGAPYAVYTMEAFGNLLEKGTSTGYYSEYATDPQPYHITTKEYDPDTGLYYFAARWYNPTSARFLSFDPIIGSREPYAYCANNPNNRVDPAGLAETGDDTGSEPGLPDFADDVAGNLPNLCCKPKNVKAQKQLIVNRINRINQIIAGYIAGKKPATGAAGIATTSCDRGPKGSQATVKWSGTLGASCLDCCANIHEAVHVGQCHEMGWSNYNYVWNINPAQMDLPAYNAEKKCLNTYLQRNGFPSIP